MGKEQLESARSFKRVSQACSRCKIKKVKCCGSTPCSRCEADDAVCYYGTRGANDKRMVSKTHVDRLLWQQKLLMKALRALWRNSGCEESGEEPSIHSIVASTGVLEDVLSSQQFFGELNLDFEEGLEDEQPSPPPAPADSISSRTSSTANTANVAPFTPHEHAFESSIKYWSSQNSIADLHLPDLDTYNSDSGAIFDFLPNAPSIDDVFAVSAKHSEVGTSPTLAERRGATWMSRCAMPEALPNHSTPVAQPVADG